MDGPSWVKEMGAVVTPSVTIDVVSAVNWLGWATALVLFVSVITWFVFYVVDAIFGGLS